MTSRRVSAFILTIVFAIGCPIARGTKVRINPDNVLEIDGKKVFFLSLSLPPPADAVTPTGKNAIEEFADAGMTFIKTGPMGEPWSASSSQQHERWLDAAAKNHIYCLVNLRELSSIKENDKQQESKLREFLNKYKNHPGLGAYKGVDEPEWGKHPVEPMLKAYRIIKQVDPAHPVWVAQAPRGTIETMKPYDVALDATGADVYPISYPPGKHSLLPNKEISMVGDYTRTMMKVAGPKKPVWMVLQITWSGVGKTGQTLRFPTFAEQRFMTYEAIINGARGLQYFGGNNPELMNERDRKLGWQWTFWERVLRPVIEEIGTKSPLYPALVAPESKIAVKAATDKSGRNDGIELCVREVGNEIFVLACKREGATVEAKFTGLPPSTSGGDVMYEEPRKMKVENGSFSDWFGPFEVHVYRFKK
jgi:hypothetical protein